MDLSKARLVFFDESRELCDTFETALLDRDAFPANADTFNLLFRTAHTIKGSAGVFGLEALVRFAHTVESVLERLRSGQVELSVELVDLLLECNDHLRRLLDAGETDEARALQDLPQGAALLERLAHYLLPGSAPARPASSTALPKAPQPPAGKPGSSPYWQLSLRFHPDTFRLGFDPLSFMAYLGRLGTLRQVQTVWRAWPPLNALDPTECFFGLEVVLEADAADGRVRETFAFLQDDSFIGILAPHAPLADYRQLAEALHARLGEPMAAQIERWALRQALTPDEVQALQAAPAAALLAAAAEPPAVTPVSHAPSVPVPALASSSQTSGKPDTPRSPRGESQHVRVEAAKLDRLINRVGELVIAASGTTLLSQLRRDAELTESVAGINALVESIRDDALTLRMVPVGDIFSRFPRMVRETAQQLGKDIRLEIRGAETEIDKSMVEKLSDPLLHIVRNALDHGMESPAKRLEMGKPQTGTVTLDAYHDAGAVVVEIRDDGAGINRDKVLAKARERALVPEGRQLSDQDILQLLFLPGFSTAATVSDLSGRGVGMDVVKRSVESLRGVVEIESNLGLGSTFRLRLPLTLAIIDGFRVEVHDATLVMPLDMMFECVDMPAETQGQHARQINVRGDWLPYISLRDMFGMPAATGPEFVVIVQFGNSRAGVVVDKLLGEVQAVIKPMGDIFKSLRCISGSTILGNGRPALVLDIPQLIQHAWRCERRQTALQNPPAQCAETV
jgi:two-component system chemotaxis sensor kinase CheA